VVDQVFSLFYHNGSRIYTHNLGLKTQDMRHRPCLKAYDMRYNLNLKVDGLEYIPRVCKPRCDASFSFVLSHYIA